jgi:putative flippase GtrA
MEARERVEGRGSSAERLRQLSRHWAPRSLLVGLGGTVVDLAVLGICVGWVRWPGPVGSALGLLAGAVFEFALNKGFAFRDRDPRVVRQALKFAATIAVALPVHTLLIWLVVSRAGAPLVATKLVADFLVFTLGQMFILRFFVFPEGKDPTAGREQ